MKSEGAGWELYNGDCVETLASFPDDSMDYSIFSPPFASLYVYSDDDRDMGNCLNADEFMEHFAFLIEELHRVIKPGRLVSFHCMNLPSSKERDGVIGLKDFRGQLIAAFERSGFIFHSEVCIWKDPVTAMQRTKAIGLLYKQLRKDSSLSRQGIADYLVTMRKRGENAERITKTHEGFPVSQWQQYASPIWSDIQDDSVELARDGIDIAAVRPAAAWLDIDPGDTLNYTGARNESDERHICPLQLGVIDRGIALWTNPGDLVLSPFAGIGSEGYQAVKMGRRFVGIELKESYYEWAIKNLKSAEFAAKQPTLFDFETV